MSGVAPALALILASPSIAAIAAEPSSIETDIIAAQDDAYHRLTVPVRIGGRPAYRFLVDTGAQSTIVSHQLAAELSLKPSGRAKVIGVAGQTLADTVMLDGFELGSRDYNGLVAPVLRQEDIGADGIVGLDSLQNQRILIDFEHDLITVDDAEHASNRGYEIVVRARRRTGQLIMTSARIDGVSVDVVLDTGAESTIGNRALQAAFARTRPMGQALLQSVTGQHVFADVGKPRELQIGGLRIRNMAIVYLDAPPFDHLALSKRPAILLGMRELRGFKRVAIDFTKRKVLFDLRDGTP